MHNALVIGLPEEGGGGGGDRADVGTLLIVHFKVLLFPPPQGQKFVAKSPYSPTSARVPHLGEADDKCISADLVTPSF